jgi:hypothetical protein
MRLWVDTNKARSAIDLRNLCRLAQRKGVEVVVHAQVYLEMRRQKRVELGAEFNERSFDKFLPQQRITIFEMALDQRTAATFADLLHHRYPTHDDWELAKQQTLGGELRAGFQVPPGSMPMTTDWLIALAVEADGESRIITHDDGEEWRVLRESEPKRALLWEEAVAWLDTLPE